MLNSAGTPEDLQELLEDEGSSSHEQPLAAANSKRVTGVATVEDLITCGRQFGKLQLHRPGDLRITRPHAAGNPFTRRLACTSSNCLNPLTHSGLCDACRVAVCDGYEQLASEQADVAGEETTVRDNRRSTWSRSAHSLRRPRRVDAAQRPAGMRNSHQRRPARAATLRLPHEHAMSQRRGTQARCCM